MSQGTTLREFGFQKECDYFNKLIWECIELKRKQRKAQREINCNEIQTSLK